MTRVQSIFAGIVGGLLCLGVIVAGAWYCLHSDSGPQVLSRRWFCHSPGSLDRETLSNDVWQFPRSPLIAPVAVQRVEWNDTAFAGRDPWGYFLFYRARVVDAGFSQHLRDVAADGLKGLPSWANHVPPWWKPQKSIPSGEIPQLELQSDDVFIEIVGADVFIYWIRAPF